VRIYTIVALCLVFFNSHSLVGQDSSKLPKKHWWDKYKPSNFVNRNISLVPVPTLSSSPETGVKGGVALSYFFNTSTKDSNQKSRDSYAYIETQYSSRKQLFVELYAQTYTKGEKYFIRGRVGYNDNLERVWGFGNTTLSQQAFETVLYKRVYVNITALAKVKRNVFVGLKTNISNMYSLNYVPKDTNILVNAAGESHSFVAGVGPTIIADFRDHPLSPYKGWYAELSTAMHNGSLGSSFNYTDVVVDVRKYLAIRKKDCLALQYFTNLTLGEVPWRELPRMGNGTIMRGYFNGRYRDRQYMAVQAEYRLPVHKLLTFAGFASMGQVQNSLDKYSLAEMRYAYGAGMRILVNKAKRIALRIDYAKGSTGNTGLYLKIGEAF